MPKPFYARSEADLASGAQNLISIVTPVPATYGLTAGQVTAYTSQSTLFSTLLAQAILPATRTSVVVEQKNAAKKVLRSASAQIAKIITAIPTVTNAQLLTLQLNERIIPQPRPVPAEPPVIEVDSVSGRLVNVRLHGAAPDSGRGKPFGAIGANIFSFVGEEAPTDPRQFHFEGMATRTITQIIFPNTVPSGATIWLGACWVSARGQIGAARPPISFTLQGGAIGPIPVAA